MRLRNLPTKELQRRIDSITWYHEFDFGDGLVARDRTDNATSHRKLWQFIQGELEHIDFRGKTVLDIGCWDGYWSFYAERRGAAKVLATDDSQQNWAGPEGLRFAHELLGSSVDIDPNQSVYELSKLARTFDVILCLGVYYHLIDPFYAFAEIRHCCHDNTVVIFEGDMIHGIVGEGAMYRRDTNLGPRFVPTPHTLRTLLNGAYFEIIREAALDMSPEAQPQGLKQRLKDALRSRQIDPQVHRVAITCRPTISKNDVYLYPPPFGLAAYDERWR